MITEHPTLNESRRSDLRSMGPLPALQAPLVRRSLATSLGQWLLAPKGLAAVGLVIAVELARTSGSFLPGFYVGALPGVVALAIPIGLLGVFFRRRWGFTLAGLLFAMACVFGLSQGGSSALLASSALSGGLALLILAARSQAERGHPVWEALCGKSNRMQDQTEPITYLAIAIVAVPILAASGIGFFVSLDGPARPLAEWLAIVAGLALGIGVIAQRPKAMTLASVVGIAGSVAAMAMWARFPAERLVVPLGDPFGLLAATIHLGMTYAFLWASWRLGLDGLRKSRVHRDKRI